MVVVVLLLLLLLMMMIWVPADLGNLLGCKSFSDKQSMLL
jgi:hypothetical protein